MDSFLELTQNVSGTTQPVFTGIRIHITLVDSNNVLKPLEVALSSANIIKRISSSYFNFIIPVDVDLLSDFNAIVESAELEYTIVMITADGTEYDVIVETIPFTSYRVDQGANSITVTITSSAFRTDTQGSDFTVTKYSRKKKTVNGPHTFYEYDIDPLLLRVVGIGSTLTDGSLSATITSKRLKMSGKNMVFTIEAEV